MDDFEELLVSDSDEDEHKKEEIKKGSLFGNYELNDDSNNNHIKKPSKEIFKGLVSDESEESINNKPVQIEKKVSNKKHSIKKSKIIFNLTRKISKPKNEILNQNSERILKNSNLNETENSILNDNLSESKNNLKISNKKDNITPMKKSIISNLFDPYIQTTQSINKSNNTSEKNSSIKKNSRNTKQNIPNVFNPYINNDNSNSNKSTKYKFLTKQVFDNECKLNKENIINNNDKKIIHKKANSNNLKNTISNFSKTNDNQTKKDESKIEEMKDLNISEGYYLSLKPEIAKIILEDLTDSKEINDQNNKIKFILEELNMINSSLQEHHKKKNNFDNLFNNEHFEKIDKITVNFIEEYKNIQNRIQVFSDKNYIDLDEKESVLEDIDYYEKKNKYLKNLNRVNENIISGNEKNPKIKDIFIKKIEINYGNSKLENEKITKMIKRNKKKIPENEKKIDELKKQLNDLQNEAKNNYNIDENFNKEEFEIINKDLLDEKEKIKKRLEIILNFSEIESQKYKNCISINEKEIEKKTNEKKKLLYILKKLDEKTEHSKKVLEQNLIPLQKIQEEIKKKRELEREKEIEENIIRRAKRAIDEKEKKERQKRNKLILMQSLSLEKMKKKINEKKNKNYFNTLSKTSRNNKSINQSNNNSKNNISNNPLLLTETSNINDKEVKSRNLKLKINNINLTENDKDLPSKSNSNKNSLKTERITNKQKTKIDGKVIRLILNKDKLNNIKHYSLKNIRNIKEDKGVGNDNIKKKNYTVKQLTYIMNKNDDKDYYNKEDNFIKGLIEDNKNNKEEKNKDKTTNEKNNDDKNNDTSKNIIEYKNVEMLNNNNEKSINDENTNDKKDNNAKNNNDKSIDNENTNDKNNIDKKNPNLNENNKEIKDKKNEDNNLDNIKTDKKIIKTKTEKIIKKKDLIFDNESEDNDIRNVRNNNIINSNNLNKKDNVDLKRYSVDSISPRINFIPNSERIPSRNFVLENEIISSLNEQEQPTNNKSIKTTKIILPNDTFLHNDDNSFKHHEYLTPKFKVFDENNFHYNNNHKSAFHKSSTVKFLHNDFDEFDEDDNVKNNKYENNNISLNNNSSKKSSIESNKNKYLSSFKENNDNINNINNKYNYNNEINYNTHYVKSKMSFGPINHKTLEKNYSNNDFPHYKLTKHSSNNLSSDLKIFSKKSMEDNISEIENDNNEINKKKRKGSLDTSFFSSEDNQITDNILPNQNIHDFDS